MKKYATISLFIFWALVTAVVAAGLIYFNKSNSVQTLAGSGATNPSLNITGVSPTISTLTLNMAEISKHNFANSCWLLISGKVYDVTTFLSQHPGGESTILPTCGTDATVAFNTKDKPNPSSHSSTANAMLADYFIGNFNQVLNLGAGQTTVNAKKTTPVATKPAVTTAPKTVTPTTPTTSTSLTLSMAELAKHNSANSCWLLISGKVYDVTTFMNSHPGGVAEILNTCGTDATVAYATRGGTGAHSASAYAELAAYYIGDLNQTVTTSPTNPTAPPVANPTFVPSKSGRGDDNDD